MTDSSGESIKFRDGVVNFFTSPLWTDFKQTFMALLDSLWTKGWYDTWNQLMDDLDPLGERQAFKVSLPMLLSSIHLRSFPLST